MIKDDKRKFFTAGELANIFNVSKQSLLYYDKVHLLSPDFVSENGNRLVKRITDFLEANKMTAVGDIYVLSLENHWFSCSCSQYINKIFLRVVDQTPQEIY